MVTIISAETLRAALKRKGVWMVDARYSLATDFFHKFCVTPHSIAAMYPPVGTAGKWAQ